MTRLRRFVPFLVFVIAAVFPSALRAATTELRVLFDVDDAIASGCTVSGMPGVDQVLVTRVENDGTTARVVEVHRQVCTGGALGAPVDIDTTGWPAGFDSASGMLSVETRIPFSALVPSGTPIGMHLGFQASQPGGAHTALTHPNGDPILFPTVRGGRRRAVGSTQELRAFTLDGQMSDWGRIPPLVQGIASGGTQTVRIITISAHANTPDDFVYFAFVVNISDDAPFATDDLYTRPLGSGLTVPAPGVLANDGHPAGAPLTAVPVRPADHGEVTLNPDGSFTYSPTNPAASQTDTFEYKATDGTKESNVARVTIEVSSETNTPPAAVNDAYTSDEDVPLSVAAPGVLANDSDADGDALTATLITGPAAGTVVLAADGGFTYTPPANFFGTTTFAYSVSDGTASANATVTITVSPINDPPALTPATFNVPENSTAGTVAGTVSASDVEGDALTFAIVGGNTSGAFAINAASGQITVANAAALDFETTTQFSLIVRVSDGTDSNETTITINITDVNDAPTIAAQAFAVDENSANGTAVGTVAASDQDAGQTLAYAITGGNAAGAFAIEAATGQITVANSAALNFEVTPSFSLTVSVTDNGAPALSATATVTVTINDVNDAPAAIALSGSSVSENQPAGTPVGTLTTTDEDAGATHTYTLVAGAGDADNAAFSIAGNELRTNAVFDFETKASYSVRIRTTDAAGAFTEQQFTISIVDVNEAPVANDQAIATSEDVAVPVTLTASDVDGDALTYTIVSEPTNGTLSGTAPNLTYTPAANFNGGDSFTFKANDGTVDSNIATVTLTVSAVNDAPVATADSFATNEDTPLNVAAPGVLANDADVEGSPLTAILVSGPSSGTLTLNANGSFSYTPNVNFNGTDSFSYRANDGAADSNIVTVTITVNAVNDAPVAVNDVYATDEDVVLNVAAPGVLANDTDVDGSPLAAVLVSGPSSGTLALDANGSFSYTPNAHFNGSDSFTYKANDGAADSNTVTVTITVNAVNDAPVAVADAFSVDEDNPLNVAAPGVLANDTDAEGSALTAVLVSGTSSGTLTLNADGSFAYTPNADFNGTDSFTYRANDGTADSNSVTVTITVNPVNDAPVATADAYATDEDVVLNVAAPGVLANDADVEGSSLTAILVSGPSSGTLTLNADGSFAYTPNANYNGSDSFTYKANDGTVDSNTVTVTLTVNSVNDVPVAVADAYAVDEDNTLNVAAPGVLANDTDIEGSALSAVLVTGPSNGTLTLNANGSFSYAPNANYNGSDSFTYKANDGTDDSNTVTVTITVNAINDAPVAAADAYATDEDVALNVAAPGVLANDTDAEGSALSAILVSGPSSGTLTLNANGSFSYTPNANYNGSDSFTYKANDGALDSNTVTVTITVNSVNDIPVAAADAYATDEDVALNVAAPGVLANDTDVEGSTLSAVLVSGTANGTLTLNANGSFSYTPNANYNGSDSFTYKANDGTDDSNTVTVTITINAVNDAPAAVADAYATDEDVALNVAAPGVLANDTDAEGSALTAVLVSGPSSGTLTLNANGSFTYTPNANYNGSDSFTYKANDGTADSNTVTVTITVNSVNDLPTAVADAYATDEDVTLNVAAPGVLANDSDVDGTLTAVLVSGTTNGTLTLNANGSFSYTPNANYNGSDSFTYKANDGTDDSNTVTVTITINAVNDAPAAVADAYATDEDVALNVAAPGVLANDTDAEGSALTAILVTGPSSGTLTLNANGSFSYTPNANYNGSDSFTYKANDGTADSNTVTVTITVNSVNDLPTAVADAYAVDEDTTLNVAAPGVLANDTDPDNALTAVLVSGTTNGTLTLNANGSFSYTPNANYNGSDSFTYKANDGTADSNTVSVTITINAVNDAPVAVADAFSTDEDVALNVAASGVLANDTDPEGSSLTAVLVTGPGSGTLTLNANGSFTYTPNPNFNGSDSFTYKANDGTADSNTVSVTITVNSVPDAPVAVADAYAVDEDNTLNVSAPGVLSNDSDADGDTMTAIVVSTTTNGSLTLNADGSFAYTPNANYNGSDSFTYKANDGTSDSNVVTVTITVNPVNDQPVLNDATRSIDENSPNGTNVGAALPYSDPDTGQSYTFAITAGNASGAFAISNSGQITVADVTDLNYEVTQQFVLTVQITDNGTPALSDTATVTIDVNDVNEAPIAGPDSYSYIGNTEHRIAGHTGNASALAATTVATSLLANDSDPDTNPAFNNIAITAASGTTANGSRYSITTDGKMVYTPGPGFTGSEDINYTLTDGTNNTVGTITFTRTGTDMVWYVQNNHSTSTPEGTSTHPHKVLATASTASQTNNIIYVMPGDGGTTGQNAGITLKSGQKLWGNGVALVVNGGTTLIAAGSQPQIGNGAGDGVNITNISAEVKGLNIGGSANAIDVTTNAGGTVAIANNTIRSAGTEGIDVNAAGGTLTLSLSDLSIASTGSHGIDLMRTLGTLNVTALNNLNIAGTVNGAGIVGTGLMTVTGGGTWTIGSSGDRVGGAGVSLGNGGSTTGAIALSDLDVYSTGAALHVIGSGTGAATVSVTNNAATLDAFAGPAADLSNLTATLVLASLQSTNSTTTGVSLTNVNGTFSAPAGSAISNATARNFFISGGTANVTYGGTIGGGAGRAVEITSSTGGTKAFTGSISNSATGISLTTNTNTTMRFSGGLTLSTGANAAFTATGGGTVEVCDENPCNGAATGGLINTLTTTTGTALNVTSTTIGANNLEFRSISAGAGASGPTNGILLNTTGSAGGLKVKGNGGTCTYATPTCSGGTIVSATGNAVHLVSTANVSLTRMRIHDNDSNGIYGDELTGFSLDSSVVSDNDVTNVSAFEAGIKFNELYGTNSISNTTVRGTHGDNIRLEMSSGTLTSLAVSNSTIGPTANDGGGYSNGFSIVTSGSPTLNVTVTGSTFTGLDSLKQQSSGILTSIGGGTTTLTVSGSTFFQQNIGIDLGASSTGTHKFNIDNNDVNFHRTNAINIIGAGTLDGTVNNNRVGNGTADSGSMNSYGIAMSQRGNANVKLAITNNVIRNTDFEGIFVRTGDLLAGDNGRTDLTLTGNTVHVPDDNSGFPSNPRGIYLRSRQATTLCMNVANNEAQGNGAAGYHLQESDTSSLMFQGWTTNAVTTLTNNGNTTAGGAPTTNEVGAPFAGACTTASPTFP